MLTGDVRLCQSCRTIAASRRVAPGALVVEVLLWCCFLVPGFIYTLWRQSSKYEVCRACQSSNVIPLDTPAAAAAIAVSGRRAAVERVVARVRRKRRNERRVFAALGALAVLVGLAPAMTPASLPTPLAAAVGFTYIVYGAGRLLPGKLPFRVAGAVALAMMTVVLAGTVC